MQRLHVKRDKMALFGLTAEAVSYNETHQPLNLYPADGWSRQLWWITFTSTWARVSWRVTFHLKGASRKTWRGRTPIPRGVTWNVTRLPSATNMLSLRDIRWCFTWNATSRSFLWCLRLFMLQAISLASSQGWMLTTESWQLLVLDLHESWTKNKDLWSKKWSLK